MDHDSNPLGAQARELRSLLVPFINKRVEPQDVDDLHAAQKVVSHGFLPAAVY